MASDNLFGDLPDVKTSTSPDLFGDLPSAPSKLHQFMKEQPTQVPGGWVGREAAGLGAGAGAAFGRTVLGGQELVGEGLKALGVTHAGDWLVNDARTGAKSLTAQEAPYRAAAPIADFAGQMVGAAPVPAGIAGRLALGARPLVNALATGAVAGALEPTTGQNFGQEKLSQVGLGAAGGGVAHGVGNALARVVSPALTGPRNALFQEGVNLTPGQAAGGLMRDVEDKLTSVPVVGPMIQGARRSGIESFDHAAINRALAPIGEKLPSSVSAGHPAIEYAESKLHDAYENLLPKLRGELDPEMRADLTGVRDLAKNLPEADQQQLDRIIKNEIEDRFTSGGVTSGRSLKDIESELGQTAKKYRQSDDYDRRRLGGAVQELQAVLRRMVTRVNPDHADELQKINTGWANFKRVQRAATSLGANNGVFTPAQLLNSVKSLESSKDKGNYATGNSLMQDLAMAAKDVLPSAVPDSGTPGRLLLTGLLGGGGVGALAATRPEVLLGLGAAALPYTRPGMSLVRNYLAAAPQTRNALAQGIRQGTAYLVPGAAQATQSVAGQ